MSKNIVVVFIVCLTLAHSNLRAQITISGNLVDQNNKPAAVTVLFHPKGEPNRLHLFEQTGPVLQTIGTELQFNL